MQTTLKGIKINYTIKGDGHPFLILHGWGSSSDKWQNMGELLIKKGLKVIIPDLPGFGQSEVPKTAWSGSDYVEFVKNFVDFLGLENFYLAGHSFGGGIATKFCHEHPLMVDKLFLIDAAIMRKQTMRKRMFWALSKIFKVFGIIPFFKKAIYKIFLISDYNYTKGMMREVYLKIIKEDLTGILPEISTPTFIIWGEKDELTPLKQGKIIRSLIKNSELKIIPGIKHNPHLECPEILSESIAL
jgi:pimeloyl-ACP methyl ester carboxylesterase